MAKHRTHSVEFKRQVAQEFLAGETLHGLAGVWVQKYEAGDFDEDAAAADPLQQYEARITALERLVGKQALELEFLKGALGGRLRRLWRLLHALLGEAYFLSRLIARPKSWRVSSSRPHSRFPLG
jgi:transposase